MKTAPFASGSIRLCLGVLMKAPSGWLLSTKLILPAALAWILGCAMLSPSAMASDPPGGVLLQGQRLSPAGFYQFFFEATLGQTYPVTASTDLRRWSLLTNAVGGGGPLWIEDQDAPEFQRRFYNIGLPLTPVPNMVFILPGTFTMGSPDSEVGHDSTEGPLTQVTLTQGFWIGKYEVTQLEHIALFGTNYSHLTYDTRLPVDFQSWFRATNYCHALTVKERAAGRLPEGYGYRLPTEAEWEYACRAGTTTPFGIGDGTSLSSTQANFDGGFPYGGAATGRYVNGTTIGGSFPPNAWGLHDMHGNVWEWCQDWYGPRPGGSVTDPQGPASGSNRLLRGGGFTSSGRGCRSAKRDNRSPAYQHTIQGFRVVLARDP